MRIPKSKIWTHLDPHDYWMGVAFILAANSSTGNATIIVDNSNTMIAYGLDAFPNFSDSKKHIVPSAIVAIMKMKDSLHTVNIYSTSPPSYESALALLTCQNIKSFVYYPQKCEVDQKALDALKSIYCDVICHESNLNWTRDYFMGIEHK